MKNGHWCGWRAMALVGALAVFAGGPWAFAQVSSEDLGEVPATASPAPTTASPVDAGLTVEDPEQVKPVYGDTFEVHMQDLDIRRALQLLSSQGGRNIVATKGVNGNVSMDLYDVTFAEAVEALVTSSNLVKEEQGNFIYVYTPQEYQQMKQAKLELDVKHFRLDWVTARDIRDLLAPALSADGTMTTTPQAATGIGPSETDAGGMSYATQDILVVRDYPENIERIDKLIKDIDVKPRQVLIEATILRATLTENNALGVDFNTVAGIDFEGLGASSAGLTNLNTGTVDAADLTHENATFRTDFAAAVGSGGMTIGFVANETAFFIRALEGVTDVAVLANPKLLVVNKQRGQVMIGNRDGYITTTFTETTATQSVQFLETGTRLIVRPFIGRDDYVRLEVHPEDSSGSVEQVGTSALPRETTTEVTSNVLVKDGHTIVIGGLFRERTQNDRNQVPIIGNIPYLGAAFRSTSDNTVREEVIILITPRIVKQEADEAVSAQLKDDIERFRVGMRNGLQWYGRSRLAQSFLRSAKEALRSENRTQAEWCVDLALSLNPRFDEAIRLKERLTEQAYWSSHCRVSQAKYIIERMMMNELGLPAEMVIPAGQEGKPLDVEKLPVKVREAMNLRPSPQAKLPEAPGVIRLSDLERTPAQPAPQTVEPVVSEPEASDRPAEPTSPDAAVIVPTLAPTDQPSAGPAPAIVESTYPDSPVQPSETDQFVTDPSALAETLDREAQFEAQATRPGTDGEGSALWRNFTELIWTAAEQAAKEAPASETVAQEEPLEVGPIVPAPPAVTAEEEPEQLTPLWLEDDGWQSGQVDTPPVWTGEGEGEAAHADPPDPQQ